MACPAIEEARRAKPRASRAAQDLQGWRGKHTPIKDGSCMEAAERQARRPFPCRIDCGAGAINGTEKTNITIGDTNIEFKNEDSVVRTRMVEGKYPNYLAIVPTNYTSESKIQKNELMDSIKRVLIASDNNSNLVKINAGMCMDLSASDDTFGKKAKETIMCEFSGEALEIGVQGQYLTDCINCVHSDNIIIRLIDPTRPILIKDEDDEDKTLVLMPMRIE